MEVYVWRFEYKFLLYQVNSNIFEEFYGVCVFDHADDHVLNGHYFSSNVMTVEMCLSTCRKKGFRFSGVQWQIECYCGNEPAEGFKLAWFDKCDERCAGNSNQICGGSNALSVYSTPGLYLNGLCIYDYPSPNRVLSDLSKTGLKNLTFGVCKDICKGILRTP